MDGCYWNNLDAGSHHYYSHDDGDCDACRAFCDDNDDCGGVECGSNAGYCVWYEIGTCEENDFDWVSAGNSWNDGDYTCVKKPAERNFKKTFSTDLVWSTN